jgi:hypothetical protein
MDTNHCKDCCCARSWEALGAKEYTGKGIPEHITELRNDLAKYKAFWEHSRLADKEQWEYYHWGNSGGTK